MRTVRLPTPFDDPRRREALATPTCCCCCCCCLVTTLTSTTLAAVYVNETARAGEVRPLVRSGLCVAAVVGLVLAVFGLFVSLMGVGVFGGTGRGLPNVASGPVVLVSASSSS